MTGGDHGPPETMPSSTSTSLLERVKASDSAAWRRLVELYGPLVHHWCARAGLNDADAADVLQEVFQAVAANVADFRRDREGDTFRGWLRTITSNKVRDLARRRRREPRAVGGSDFADFLAQTPADEAAGVAGDFRDEEAAAVLWRAVELVRGEFEQRTWQAFWRTAVEQRSAPEAALALGMTPTAVRQAKSRVLRRLREMLVDPFDG